MTGFASKSISLSVPKLGNVSLFVEIKSVNGRFFETVAKIPSALSCLEVPMIGRLQKILRRGRVYVTVRFAEDNELFQDIAPSLKAARGYIAAAQQIKDTCNISGDLSVHHLFQLPDIFVTRREELSLDQQQLLLEAIETVAQRMMDMRKQEGERLLVDLKKRFGICAEKIKEIKSFSKKLMESIKNNINDKLELTEKGDEVAKLQLEELYAVQNKADIHEEITRFESHLKSVSDLFEQENLEKGKRLDFILQEILRETNTIMAKCTNFDISSVGVDIKVELEKAREQAQNIL